MKVKEVMTLNPTGCTSTNSLADVAGLMWDNDCGIVPVLAEGGKVVGVITDRDICMAAALKGYQLANIAVEDTISGKVFTCKTEDNVRTALETMKEKKIRRLPVLNDDGTLAGMLSMNDIVLQASEGKPNKTPDVSYADVVSTYKSICEHWAPVKVAQAAGV
jgi:CBS domain-containing protein